MLTVVQFGHFLAITMKNTITTIMIRLEEAQRCDKAHEGFATTDGTSGWTTFAPSSSLTTS